MREIAKHAGRALVWTVVSCGGIYSFLLLLLWAMDTRYGFVVVVVALVYGFFFYVLPRRDAPASPNEGMS